MSVGERMWRRMQNVVGFGTTSAPVNDAGVVSTVQHALNDITTRDAVPVVFHFGFTACLPIGTDTVTVQISGSSSNGVIVATNHKASRPTGLKPGEAMLYNEAGDHVYMRADRVIEVRAATSVLLNTPNVHCTGSITSDGDMVAAGISLDTHTHGDPQGGRTAVPG